jgi:hypothetical protein
MIAVEQFLNFGKSDRVSAGCWSTSRQVLDAQICHFCSLGRELSNADKFLKSWNMAEVIWQRHLGRTGSEEYEVTLASDLTRGELQAHHLEVNDHGGSYRLIDRFLDSYAAYGRVGLLGRSVEALDVVTERTSAMGLLSRGWPIC